MNNGGGFVGIHAAADTEYNWSWYGNMLGAYFESHPKKQEAKIDIVNTKHPSTYFLGNEWIKFDEWYNYKNINPAIDVLMTLDDSSYEGGKNGKDHPIAWTHEFEGGSVFYTGLGHTEESYRDTTFLRHVLGGIQYAMGWDKDIHKKEIQAENKWIQLFNGEDLNDWKVKIKGHPLGENYKNTFRVVDGVLQVHYDQYDEVKSAFGHIFYKNPYSSYKLRLQYRFTGNQVKGGEGWAIRNSGVMIHAQSPESMGLDQDFPVSVEVQLLGGIKKGVSRPTANVCTPGTHIMLDKKLTIKHCINSSSKTYYGDQWINLEILVRSDSLISHTINGEKVLSYAKPVIGGEYNVLLSREGERLKSGYISLQSESHPIEFKNIELLELEN